MSNKFKENLRAFRNSHQNENSKSNSIYNNSQLEEIKEKVNEDNGGKFNNQEIYESKETSLPTKKQMEEDYLQKVKRMEELIEIIKGSPGEKIREEIEKKT